MPTIPCCEIAVRPCRGKILGRFLAGAALTIVGADAIVELSLGIHGEMSERSKEAVLKTVEPKGSVGSNPTLSVGTM